MPQYCSFHLHESLLGIAVDDVREVLRSPRPVPVPTAPDNVVGLLNLRGRIVSVIDLAACLGLEREPAADGILLRREELCLLVGRVSDVIEVETGLEPPPESLDARHRGVVRGVHQLPDRLLEVLDVTRIVSPEPGDG